MRKDPVVVLGMHRSGTTLLVSWLEALGVYMGWEQDANREALYFQLRNRRMMALTGANWLYPEPFLWWIQEPERRIFLLQRLRRDMERSLRSQYLPRETRSWPALWGWKDPRTVYTLELWRDVFPDLRVLGVRRHGVDVAVSLVRRADQAWTQYRRQWEASQDWPPPMNGMERLPLREAFALWVRYNEQLDQLRRTWPALPWLDVRYEEMLQNPEEVLHRIAAFLGIPVQEEQIQRLQAELDPSRALQYRTDPDLVAFARQQEEALSRYGYIP